MDYNLFKYLNLLYLIKDIIISVKVIHIKTNGKKLRFCFYCGSLKPELKENEKDICHYCGVILPYNSNKNKNSE